MSRPLRDWGIALAIGIAAGLVFAPVLGFDFVSFDDWRLVRDNPWLREGLSFASLRRAFEAPYYLNWIPLTTLSYQLDAARAGIDPTAFHATNLGLHALASGLVFLALLRLTQRMPESACIALVFAVHPLQVEPVAWIASRKDVLSGVFFAATLLAHAHYVKRPSPWRYAGVALALAAALLSKPMAVTLPLVLLLLDGWPLGRLSGADARRAWIEKLPLLVLAGIAALVTYAVQDVVASGGHSFAVRSANAVDSLGAYLVAAVWPSGLAAFYPHPGAAIPIPRLLAAAVALLAITGGAWRLRRTQPAVLVGWLWFLGMLIPVLGFVEVGLQARADRYLYLPLLGLSLAVVFGVSGWCGASRARRRAAAVLALLVLLSFSVATRRQLTHWADSEALYRRALEVTDGNAMAHYGLAGSLASRGALEEAREQLEAAIRVNPGWTLPYERWAQLENHRGNPAAAARVYERLLELRPGDAVVHAALAELRLSSGDAEAAIRHYEQAHALLPDWREPASQLAWLLATHPDPELRDPKRAATLVGRALEASSIPEPALLETLAAARAALGNFQVAVPLALEAAELWEGAGDTTRAARIRARASGYAEGRLEFEAVTGPRPRLRDAGAAPLR